MERIVPDRKLELLQERLDAWTEAEIKVLNMYCRLVDIMTKVADNTDGYPAEILNMLKQVKEDLEKMEQRILSLSNSSHVEEARFSLLKIIGIGMSWAISTAIGAIVGCALMEMH